MGFDETIYGDDGPNRLNGNYGNSLIWGRGGDRIKLLGGPTSRDLTFSSVGGHTSIKKDDDLLAIVQNTIAADIVFI